MDEGTVTVSVEELVAGFGLKLELLPAGKPLTESVTEALNPPVRVIVTV